MWTIDHTIQAPVIHLQKPISKYFDEGKYVLCEYA